MSEQWMSIVEYARAFSISDMTVRRRIKNGKLKAELRDGKYYIMMGEPSRSTSTLGQMQSSSHVSSMTQNTSNSFQVEKGGAVVSPRGWSSDQPNRVELPRGLPSSVPRDADLPEIRSLVDYCNRSLNRISSIERHIQESYQNKFSKLEMEIKAKNQEIAYLKQKVEDLQILIKMYDKSPS